uniref:Echinoderm microtubule-associated protein-like 4 n=1 Tax=Macrostomum lignano TaxID=282301 RepID=A0A1I8FLN8_9PLAT
PVRTPRQRTPPRRPWAAAAARPTRSWRRRLRRTRHDLRCLLRTDFEELRQSCRHCLHSVDQMFTDTLAIVQPNASRKNLRRDSSPRPHSQERLKAYRLESRAIDTRLFELEQLVEELRSALIPAGSESAAQRSATAGGCGISDSAASGGLDGRRGAVSRLTWRGSVGKRRLPAEALRRVSPSNRANQNRAGYDQMSPPLRAALWKCQTPGAAAAKKSGGLGTKLTGKSHAQLPAEIEEYDNVAQSTVDGHPPPLASPSPSPPPPPSPPPLPLSVESAEPLPRINATRQSQPPPPRPRPQVAFSDTVKVDDGSQVIKLNWADASEPAAAAATASAAKSPTSGSPRTPPPPPPRKSSTGGTGVTSSPLGGPGSRQRPSDYENVVGRVRPGSQAEEDAEQVWQRQSTVHFRSRSDSDRPGRRDRQPRQLPLWRCNRRSRS